ncbi:flagellar biosynthesis protein FlhB [Helicobacter enhydrae]|uniref:Flagellar biosynthesis protein FlhB n=1 Tax=Helicobacter enhydrae TaxID=222136 RepID=A0A1B1U488_9HELI|nr:EscU/YscU/HrcU family type III secretion system export apparatus switch protein [Helicobacter enhydrae]ANV97587.1 flagellar biosynthesis protein FlhB [Helicobacter enhydrae]
MHKKAAAIAYNQTKNQAPQVIASGQGTIAQSIIAKAQEFDIPLFANATLVDSLLCLQVDEEIPPELYQAMVEVFLWLQECEQKAQISR